MNLAAIIILYHPPSEVLNNILSYYDEVQRLYIFDNTETHSCKALFDGLDKVVFIHNAENRGIARRLNEGCNMAIKDGFDWALTMDQDSRFPNGLFASYMSCMQQHGNWDKVAVFGMKYEAYEIESFQECKTKLTPFIITSGMLLNLPIVKLLQGFDEKLFIDAVDHEYCLRANQHGHETVRFNNLFLHHVVGAVVKRASLKTLYLVKKAKSVHSPVRCYYMLRNSLYLAGKYENDFPGVIAHNNLVVKMHLNRSFWYGRSAWKTWWYARLARNHFKKQKMGKLETKS